MNRMVRWVFWVAAGAALPGAASHNCLAELFPLEVGQRYVYIRSDPCDNSWAVEWVINGKISANSHDYWHLLNFNYDGDWTWIDWGYHRSTADKLYAYDGEGGESVELQTGPVGSKWVTYEPDDEYNYKVIEVVSIGPVTVPYGTLAGAYKYRKYKCVDPNNLGLGRSPYWYEWWVPGTGFVKDEDYWVDGPAPVIQELAVITHIGDIDLDGTVTFQDMAWFAAAWRSLPEQPEWDVLCDVSDPQDNIIDWRDLKFVAEGWLQ